MPDGLNNPVAALIHLVFEEILAIVFLKFAAVLGIAFFDPAPGVEAFVFVAELFGVERTGDIVLDDLIIREPAGFEVVLGRVVFEAQAAIEEEGLLFGQPAELLPFAEVLLGIIAPGLAVAKLPPLFK